MQYNFQNSVGPKFIPSISNTHQNQGASISKCSRSAIKILSKSIINYNALTTQGNWTSFHITPNLDYCTLGMNFIIIPEFIHAGLGVLRLLVHLHYSKVLQALTFLKVPHNILFFYLCRCVLEQLEQEH